MVRSISKQAIGSVKAEVLLILFAFMHSAGFSQQYHNPWNVDVGIDIGPSSLVLDEQLPSERHFLQSPFYVPYDTSRFLFDHNYKGIWVRSQGRVDVGINLQISHEDGYMLGLGFRAGFVPSKQPREFESSWSSNERASRSIEVMLNSAQAQGGWDLFHERWNISKSHLLRVNGLIGYSWLTVDDHYSYHYSESNSTGSMEVNSKESFTWKANGVNWGFGLEYIWFPNKIRSGIGLGISARFERHYLRYDNMTRESYVLNGKDQMADLTSEEKFFVFGSRDSHIGEEATVFDGAISLSDKVYCSFQVFYRFGRSK